MYTYMYTQKKLNSRGDLSAYILTILNASVV